jgi:hypothetical protein
MFGWSCNQNIINIKCNSDTVMRVVNAGVRLECSESKGYDDAAEEEIPDPWGLL